MRARWLVVVPLTSAWLGCGSSDAAKTALDAAFITVISAELEATKPDGNPWDDPGTSDALPAFLAAGAMVYLGQPDLAPLAGRAFASGPSGASDTAPDSFVRFSAQRYRVTSNIQLDSVLPNWDYPLVFRPHDAEYVTVSVIDADPGDERDQLLEDPVGTDTLATSDVLQPGLRELGPFGGVRRLVLQIERYSPDYAQSKAGIDVDGRQPWTDAGLNVVAGQMIHVKASGTIRVSNDRGGSTSPDGFSLPKWQVYSVLRGAPHGGLLVRIGKHGQPRFVGRAADFVVASSGPLFLGPNDDDLWNNTGSFDVSVDVR